MSTTRKAVRRDDDIPAMARLLFEEIWEMHQAGACFAKDEWFADELNASKSSIRRWRRQLREAGYLQEQKSDGKRYLIPIEVINPDQSDQEQSATSSQSDQEQSQEAIRSDQDIDVNNPAEADEDAPAREDTTSGQPEDPFSLLVDIWRETPGTPAMQDRHMRIFERWAKDGLRVDPKLFREVLRDQLDSTQGRGVGLDMSILRKEYESRKDEVKAKYLPSADPDLNL